MIELIHELLLGKGERGEGALWSGVNERLAGESRLSFNCVILHCLLPMPIIPIPSVAKNTRRS